MPPTDSERADVVKAISPRHPAAGGARRKAIAFLAAMAFVVLAATIVAELAGSLLFGKRRPRTARDGSSGG